MLQEVEHVFIVGVGGGVPHYTDWDRHVSYSPEYVEVKFRIIDILRC